MQAFAMSRSTRDDTNPPIVIGKLNDHCVIHTTQCTVGKAAHTMASQCQEDVSIVTACQGKTIYLYKSFTIICGLYLV